MLRSGYRGYPVIADSMYLPTLKLDYLPTLKFDPMGTKVQPEETITTKASARLMRPEKKQNVRVVYTEYKCN
jgi:hypothetical protein